jgi:hypothetical protein
MQQHNRLLFDIARTFLAQRTINGTEEQLRLGRFQILGELYDKHVQDFNGSAGAAGGELGLIVGIYSVAAHHRGSWP